MRCLAQCCASTDLRYRITSFAGLGPNAIRVLKEFGVLDAVLKKTNPGELKPKGFRFFSGLDGHELVYEVRRLRSLRRCPESHGPPSTQCRRPTRASACTGAHSQARSTVRLPFRD